MAKKLSLRAAAAHILALETALITERAEAEKKLKSALETKQHYVTSSAKHEQEIESIHDILDAIPTAPLRKPTECSYVTRSLSVRLAGYFASRSHPETTCACNKKQTP